MKKEEGQRKKKKVELKEQVIDCVVPTLVSSIASRVVNVRSCHRGLQLASDHDLGAFTLGALLNGRSCAWRYANPQIRYDNPLTTT